MRRFAVFILLAGVVGCGGPDPTTAPKPEPTPQPPTQPVNPPPTTARTPAATTGSVTGTVTHPATKGQMLAVGYVEVAGTEFVSDVTGMTWDGADAVVESTTHKPRVSTLRFEKGVARYELAGLPPGTYVVYASVRGGPTAWAKLEVKAGDKLTRDLTIETGKGGTVEVTLPADFTGEVRMAPSDLAPADDPNAVVGRVAADLGLGAKAEKGKATVRDVPPGKYTLFAIPGILKPLGSVEVKAGETAKAEIKEVK